MINLHDPNSTLLGTDLESRAQVLRYLSWGTCELMRPVYDMKMSLLKTPNDKKAFHIAKQDIDEFVSQLEERFEKHAYLVGDRLTVADLFVLSCFNRPFHLYFDSEWRAKHVSFMNWATTIMNSECLTYYYKDFKFIDKQIELH